MDLSLDSLRVMSQSQCDLCGADIWSPVPMTVTEVRHTADHDGVVETRVTLRGLSRNGDFPQPTNQWHDLLKDEHYTLCDKCMKEAKKNMRRAQRNRKVAV